MLPKSYLLFVSPDEYEAIIDALQWQTEATRELTPTPLMSKLQKMVDYQEMLDANLKLAQEQSNTAEVPEAEI